MRVVRRLSRGGCVDRCQEARGEEGLEILVLGGAQFMVKVTSYDKEIQVRGEGVNEGSEVGEDRGLGRIFRRDIG